MTAHYLPTPRNPYPDNCPDVTHTRKRRWRSYTICDDCIKEQLIDTGELDRIKNINKEHQPTKE